MRKAVLLFILAVALAACKTVPTNSNTASADAKRYPFKGKVISVDRSAKTAVIDHEPVAGLMDEGMAMPFPIRADWVWDDLKPGCEISADLVVDNKGPVPFWLENIGILSSSMTDQPVNDNFAQVGKQVPDFHLTNQDGKPISIQSFKGKAFAITFIYAKCPLPDYCTRMSTNFSDLANTLKNDAALKDKLRLLSISFDPEHDTPQKLREYGIGYLGNDPNANFDIWQLAVGKDAEVKHIADFFGLQYQTDPADKTKINHSLVTAVVDPAGKVTKMYSGNDWKPEELLAELKAAAGVKN